MISEIDQTTTAIMSELAMIEQNRKHRNEIYQTCMDQYINNLKKEINQLESTQELNIKRNKDISLVFQSIYDKTITSASITVRKIKQTAYQKKLFWENLIKNNSALNDLDLKKDFYLQKRDAEDRYLDAIQQKKSKKIPYSLLLGKNKKKQGLRDWRQNNRTFEDKVQKGTTTLNQWRSNWDKTSQNYRPTYYQPNNQIPEQAVRNDFVRSGQENINRPLGTNYSQNLAPKQFQSNPSGFDFLKNFQKKY